MSSDEDVITVRKKKFIIDSDSSDNENNVNSCNDAIADQIECTESTVKKTNDTSITFSDNEDNMKVVKLDDKNSVEDDNSFNLDHSNPGEEPKNKDKRSWFRNSDLYEMESSEDDDYNISRTKNKVSNRKKSMLKNNDGLYEDHSSEDENSFVQESQHSETGNKEANKVKSRAHQKEKLSKTNALNQMQEIQRESQRMMRQSRTAIPYHRPKQRTLEEFLARRKTAPKVPLRTSANQLQLVWKAIEQREKEAEIFFKSDSSDNESGDEEAENKKNDQDIFDMLSNGVIENNCDIVRGATKEDGSKDKPHPGVADFGIYTDGSIETISTNLTSSEKHEEGSVAICFKETYISKEPPGEPQTEAGATASNETNKPSTETDVTNTITTERCAESEEFSLRLSESQSVLSSTVEYEKDDEEVLRTKCSGETNQINRHNGGGTENYSDIHNFDSKADVSETNSNSSLNNVTLTCEERDIIETASNMSPCRKENYCLGEHQIETSESVKEEELSKNNFCKTQCVSVIKTSDVPKMKVFDTEEIVLDSMEANPGVGNLIERFFNHLSYNKCPVKKKAQVDLSVVSAETDSEGKVSGINTEVVTVLVGDEAEEEDPDLAIPGAKHARLRAQLQAQMKLQRCQEWEKKQQEQKLYEEEIYEGEKDICDAEEEGEESEKEAVNENGGTESDGEQEEDDTEDSEEENEIRDEKKKNKNTFIEDEAEVSDDASCLEEAEEDEMPYFPKQRVQEDAFEPESPSLPSPPFQLTGLERKNSSHSESSTPSKNFTIPRIITPVRPTLASLVDKSPLQSSQNLMDMCSGTFVSQPVFDDDEAETEDYQLFLTEDSQTSQDQEPSTCSLKTTAVDGKGLVQSALADDEDATCNVVSRKVKKLQFSDDEDEGDKENLKLSNDSNESDDEEEEVMAVAINDVDYDSEENEVVKTAGEFLDKEAELSESEWGSEDEDEQGLDVLDMEEADREKIDQRRLKRQLDEIHMKQMLIKDKREVRLLQEMLLEDGELHSENRRKRLFRWSNNTTFAEDNKTSLDSDEEKAEDDEDESWRKARYEREQYLAKLSSKGEALEIAANEHFESKLMQLGEKTLQRLQNQHQKPPTVKAHSSPEPKKPFSTLMNMKRGSFLMRKPQVLSRLAQMTTEGSINVPKNSSNFVFASISPTKDEEVQPLRTKKRKIPVLSLPSVKKTCIQPKSANRKSLFEALAKVQT